MGYLFVAEGLVADPSMAAIDSTLLKAKGHVWHKSSMEKGVVPRSGIDTDARWGYSHTRGWIFGHKLHLTSTTGALVVPLTADVTTANVRDSQMYIPLTSSSLLLQFFCILLAVFTLYGSDPGYDDKKLYGIAKGSWRIRRPVADTPKYRLELYAFINLHWGSPSTIREEYP